MIYFIIAYLVIAIIDYLFCRQIHKEGFYAAKWTQRDRVFAIFVGLCPILNVGFAILMIGIAVSEFMDKFSFWDKEAKW